MARLSPEAVVQTLPQPALIVDADRCVFPNDQFQRLAGLSEYATGTELRTLRERSGFDFGAVARAIERTFAGKEPQSLVVSRSESDAGRLRGEARPITEDGETVGVLIRWESAGESEPTEQVPDEGGSEGDRHERFYRAFENHRAPMLLIDPESGTIEDANDAAIDFYGYGSDQLASMRIQEINRLSSEEVALERERARRESRNHFNFEHELDSGEIRPVEVHSSPIEFGNEQFLFSVVHDVSERERHKDALERERAFADSALNSLTDIFYVTDRSGGMRRWNDRLPEVTGYGDEAIESMNASDFFLDRESDRVEATLEAVSETGTQVSREFTLETESGGEIPYEFTGSLLTIDGEPIGVAGTGRDISERKAREQDLRQLRRAIEATPHGVFLTDPDGYIEYTNPAFEAMTGYAEQEVLGRTPKLLKSGEHSESFYRDLWETITSGEIWQAQIVNERKSGERYHAHQTIAPITDESGTTDAFVAIQTDITDRKERQQHFRVLSRVLRHNLQNDLTVIRGHAEQIDGERHAVEQIVDKTEDILQTARKEREIATILSEDIHRRELDIVAVAEKAITDVSHEYPNAVIEAELCEEAVAVGTPRLKAALTELLENAIIHNDSADVSVTVRSTGDGVEIEVCDDGTGIPESERDILEMGAEIDPLYHGSGLGLWLVYWIARRSGGTLTFSESEPSGSCVTITLERERVVDTRGYATEQ